MEIAKFLGLKNTDGPERFKPGQLEAALDVDVDNAGTVRTRTGMAQLSATAGHSLFSDGQTAVVVQGTDMKRVTASGAVTQIKRLSYGAPLSYAAFNGVIYYTNGIDTGRLVNGSPREWGVRPPVGQPRAFPGIGGLPPGRYQYAMTFVRADGLESGSRTPAMVELPTSGLTNGIVFTGLEVSSDPDVVGKVLYISGPGGTELYRAMVLPASASTASYLNAGHDTTTALDEDLVEPAPPGSALEIHSGVMYVVDGSVAWASDLYSFERFRRARRFLQLPGRITLFAAVSDGIFAATDAETWFFEGHDPQAMKARKVMTYGAIPGTVVKTDTLELVPEGRDPSVSVTALLWTSPYGVILGSTGGLVKNLTEDDYSFPTAPRGAAHFRTARGYSSYVVSLQAPGAPISKY